MGQPHSTRRTFLKCVALGGAAAGAGVINASLAHSSIQSGERGTFSRIVYRNLGSTGYKVSEIGFGVLNTWDSDLIHAAVDAGINYFDTAPTYMNGVCEETLGKVMKTKRDKVFLTTKIHRYTPDVMLGTLEKSLKRLRTDHVDLWLFHGFEYLERTQRDDIKGVFDKARQKGLTRFVGFSTHRHEILGEVLENRFWEAVTISYNYFSPEGASASIKKAREAGMAVIAMKSLLGGTLTPEKHQEIDGLRGFNPQQALIKWALENPFVDTVIPGISSFEHLADDIAVMGKKMTVSERKSLQRYCGRLRGRYCSGAAGCTGCRDACPKGVDVSDINRCLGYIYGYNNIELARENYRHVPYSSRVDLCAGCEVCSVRCIHGIDLTENIRRARRFFA